MKSEIRRWQIFDATYLIVNGECRRVWDENPYPSIHFGRGHTENRFLTPRPSVAVTGRRALDEKCACNERAVCKQRGSRKMRVLDLAGRSERTHLTPLLPFAFKYSGA